MNKRESNNTRGELVTVNQMAETCNLGTSTTRKIAEESGSMRHIGRSVRINRRIFLDYIEAIYS